MFSIIVPVYLNAETLPALIERLDAIAAELQPAPLETVFVVDGSPDDSWQILKQRLPAARFQAQLIAHSRNFGSFAAIRTGLAAANGDHFAVMAADLQEPPELAKTFFTLLRDDTCDVAVGVRNSRSDGFVSDLASRLFWALYRRLVQPEMPAGGIDVFGCSRKVRDALLALTETNSTLVGLLVWAGFRRQSVPYDRLPRPAGRSAWSLRRKIRYMEDSFYAFSDLPLRILTLGGGLGIAATIALSVVIVLARLLGEISVPGYAPTVLIVMFFGALNLLCLGLIGGYVWRSFENSKQRPHALTLAHERFQGPSEKA
ncbi:glycosyltransferase family 2 protein [Ferrovibrio sp.]|uniref:glycosyltransferase family 2 protein n=1 Tax=Ferrovibrio sp. TaxID=1917215 RepID=UPI00311DA1F4